MVVNWVKSALLSLNSCISQVSNIKNPCISVKTRHFTFWYLNMSLQDLKDVTTQYLLRTKCQYLASIQNDIQMQDILIKIWNFNIKIGVMIIYTLRTCVKFTYVGKETKFFTHLLSNTSIKIAYKTSNKIGSHLEIRSAKFDKYSASGVYKSPTVCWRIILKWILGKSCGGKH
jgi:hypothetical protein